MQVVKKAVGAPFQYGHIECFPPEQTFWLAEKRYLQPEFQYLLAAALLDYTPLVDPPDANCMPQQ